MSQLGEMTGAHEGQLDKGLVDGGGEISPRKQLCMINTPFP